MLIIPAIDLSNGCCVRLTQGLKNSARVYDNDPIRMARSFEADSAEMLHIVDLDGAFFESNSRNRAALQEIIREINIPIQFGGGLRSLHQVKEVIDLGVSRVVIGTLAVEAPELLSQMLELFGPKHLAVGIDARDGEVVMHGWETKTAISAVDLAQRVASMGVDRIIYTDVRRDGMLTGPNINETCLIAAIGVNVTASGGISSLEDLQHLKMASHCGIDSVIVGKALYEKRFTLIEALSVARTTIKRNGTMNFTSASNSS